MSWRLSVPFFLPTLLPVGWPFPWAGRYSLPVELAKTSSPAIAIWVFSLFPHSSLSIIQKAEIYVKFFLQYFAIYFRRHYHRDIKSQDKNARGFRNVLCCIQNCRRVLIREGEWHHYSSEISSPSLFWGKMLQACWIWKYSVYVSVFQILSFFLAPF